LSQDIFDTTSTRQIGPCFPGTDSSGHIMNRDVVRVVIFGCLGKHVRLQEFLKGLLMFRVRQRSYNRTQQGVRLAQFWF